MNPVIAKAYLANSGTFAIYTIPGRRVSFIGGAADIKSDKDIPHLLQRADLTLDFDQEWALSFLPRWMDDAGKVQATILVAGQDPNAPTWADAIVREVEGTDAEPQAVAAEKRGPGRPRKS